LIHREVQFEECFLRPCSEEGSDAALSVIKVIEKADCGNCAEMKLKTNRHAGSWLGRLPLTEMKIGAGTQIGVPICITRSNGCLRW